MPTNSRYDFKKEKEKKVNEEKISPLKPKKVIKKDPRKNFHITKCCGNCKHYYYTGVKSRRGYCKLPNQKSAKKGAYHKNNIEHIAIEEGWPTTHTTCLCDSYELRTKGNSLKVIKDYIERDLTREGKPREKENKK